ncbi:MAG: CAP domain-containing protein [Nitrososphaeraceae archaeon]
MTPLNGMMNRITNLWVLLIVTSLFLPSTAIMYASGSPENNTAPPSGFTENNALPPEDSGIVSPPGEQPSTPPGEGIAPPSGPTGTNDALPSGPTGTNDALNRGFRIEGNNTGNVTQSANIAESILAEHNKERALVGVAPLTWSDKLAADAQAWADHLSTTGEFAHSPSFAAGKGEYGEAIAGLSNTTDSGIIDGQMRWAAEKDNPGYHGEPFYPDPKFTNGAPGHYTQMVWRNTTEVGCATAPAGALPFPVLVCRYNPSGNFYGQPAY